MTESTNRRILVIDNNRTVHEDFRKILVNHSPGRGALDATEAFLFGEALAKPSHAAFEIDSAFQGAEGLELVKQAMQAARPYTLAFVDVQMPGWDSIETASRIWAVDPDLQIVICTAYSDYSWEESRWLGTIKHAAPLGLTTRCSRFIIS